MIPILEGVRVKELDQPAKCAYCGRIGPPGQCAGCGAPVEPALLVVSSGLLSARDYEQIRDYWRKRFEIPRW